MRSVRLTKPLLAAALVSGLVAAGWLLYVQWPPGTGAAAPGESPATIAESNEPTDKIIVGDQAQQNLGITAKPLKVGSFWRTFTVQGMVVDRPGISDRQVVAPATGVVTQILYVPGDVVRPGDVLFTLRLSSDSLHQAQAELFKASQDIELAEVRLKRLLSAGDGVAQVRIVENEQEIARLKAAAKTYRHELLVRGFTAEEITGVIAGELVKEIPIRVPQVLANQESPDLTQEPKSIASPPTPTSPGFELQELKVEVGQQVETGEMLCLLSNHQSLAIEGRAFREETLLLERSVRERWPVEVDFQEVSGNAWPAIEQTFLIEHIANTIDPVTRTFAFRMPLQNQSKAVNHDGRSQLLWRFRPGQKVRLSVRVEETDDVFVLPADAVVREGPEAFVFTQNVNTFERKPVHVVFHDRDRAVLANDGSLPTYLKGQERWTIAAVVRSSAAQLNRMAKAGSSEVPKGFHIHADGSLHKNEDEGK